MLLRLRLGRKVAPGWLRDLFLRILSHRDEPYTSSEAAVAPRPRGLSRPARQQAYRGHLPLFDPDMIAAMNVADALRSPPDSFAWLLDAAGGLLLEAAGKIAPERPLK